MFMLTGRKLALTLAFTVLVALAFGAGCRGFFVKPVLTAISVGPTGQNLQQGDTLQMSARGTYDTQPPQDISGQVLWSSDNLAVATVAKGGLVKGVSAPGTANISATLQTLTGSASVTVVLTGVTAITISPQGPINVKQGSTQNFTCAATVTGQSQPVDITASVNWSTSDTTNTNITNGSNPAVFTVNSSTPNEQVIVTATYTVGSTVFTNTVTVNVIQ